MDGGHQALLNADAFLEDDMDQRSEAVGGAGSVGNDRVLGRVILVLVDAHDNGLDIALARSRDDDFLGTGCEVTGGSGRIGEQAGGFDNVINAHLAPGQIGRIALSHDTLDLMAVDNDDVVFGGFGAGLGGGDFVLELALDGVVLDLVGEIVRVS